jgi:hypothetical protein
LAALLAAIAVGTACSSQDRGADTSALSPDEARAIAKEAYVYGYAMIENYKTTDAYFVDKGGAQYKAPINTLDNVARVYTPADTAIVSPNSDTPYSFMWLDLRAEPMVLGVPEIEAKRYYSIQLIDLYTFNWAYIGTRATGNGAGHYLIAGPDWQGTAPEGVSKVLRSETDFVVAVYRTQLFGPNDLENVVQIQNKYTVQTLSGFLGRQAPAPAASIDFPAFDAEKASSLGFIGYLNFLLQFCPTDPSETDLMARFARIGITPGAAVDSSGLSAEMHSALSSGIADATAAIDSQTATMTSSLGYFGTRADMKNDYLKRSAAARIGLWGNSPREAYYPIYLKDGDGQQFDGSAKNYTVVFDELPPVDAFWSLTMYDGKTQALVANPLKRYLINSPMLPDLTRDADGGLTLYIQNESPGKDKESNWLPAPNGPFYMAMRLYIPKQEALDGTWKAPPAKPVD